MADLLTIFSKGSSLVLILFAGSIIISYISEWISIQFNLKAEKLFLAIFRLLEPDQQASSWKKVFFQRWRDGGLGQESYSQSDMMNRLNTNLFLSFCDHKIIRFRFWKKGIFPNYISPSDFSSTLIELLSEAGESTQTTTVDRYSAVKLGIEGLKENYIKSTSYLTV